MASDFLGFQRFRVYRNDAGAYTEIFRGGNEAAIYGSSGLNSGTSNPGFGFGYLETYAGPYGRDTPGSGPLDYKDDLAKMEAGIAAEIKQAVEAVRAAADPAPSHLLEHVYG